MVIEFADCRGEILACLCRREDIGIEAILHFIIGEMLNDCRRFLLAYQARRFGDEVFQIFTELSENLGLNARQD